MEGSNTAPPAHARGSARLRATALITRIRLIHRTLVCPSLRRSLEPRSGQVGGAHQVTVTLASGRAAFVDGPHHQALAATHVAGGENSFHAGGEFAVVGP